MRDLLLAVRADEQCEWAAAVLSLRTARLRFAHAAPAVTHTPWHLLHPACSCRPGSLPLPAPA